MKLRRRSRRSGATSGDTERLLRSGKASTPPDNPTSLLPGEAEDHAEQALSAASGRLSEALRLLGPHRERPETAAGGAYREVHAARSDLAAFRIWQSLARRFRGHSDSTG